MTHTQLQYLNKKLSLLNQDYLLTLRMQHNLIQVQGSILMAQAWAWATSCIEQGRPELVDEAVAAWDALGVVK